MVFIWKRWTGFVNLQWVFALSRSITKHPWWRLWCKPSPVSVLMRVHGSEVLFELLDLDVLDPHSQSFWLNSGSSCTKRCVYLMFCWLVGQSGGSGIFTEMFWWWHYGQVDQPLVVQLQRQLSPWVKGRTTTVQKPQCPRLYTFGLSLVHHTFLPHLHDFRVCTSLEDILFPKVSQVSLDISVPDLEVLSANTSPLGCWNFLEHLQMAFIKGGRVCADWDCRFGSAFKELLWTLALWRRVSCFTVQLGE